ncbi:MAG: hypothetical protein Q7U28_09545 [Aquabacterium sp.]|nr:hypothetical protein [Aquabacterium sp.]
MNNAVMWRSWSFRFFWILLTCLFFKYAWLSEDAFINFRVIENFKAGDGLTWNPGERVQVFTSALWMLLTLVASVVTGSSLIGTLVMSFLLVLAAFWHLFKATDRMVTLFLPLAVFYVLCPSIRDYLSSGLETPLLMCVLAWFTSVATSPVRATWRRICFLAAICVLVRHDTALLILPFLIQRLYGLRWWVGGREAVRAALDACIGLSPVMVWTVFSVVYYGAVVPNTAGAKMVSGFDTLAQAGYYFVFMQYFDPAAYALIFLSLLVVVGMRSRYAFPLVSALLLFLIYLLLVGADYMAGRFFVGPLTLCVVILAAAVRDEISNSYFIKSTLVSGFTHFEVILLLVVNMVFAGSALTVLNDSEFRGDQSFLFHGIADERNYYYGKTDIYTILSTGVQHYYVERAKSMNAALSAGKNIFVACNIGMTGYYANRRVYIVDPLALSDRFLASLPLSQGPVRIGHFERLVPNEYISSLMLGRNMFTQPFLRNYYGDMRLVVSGPLFSYARWVAIWRVSSGIYKRDLARLTPADGGGALRVTALDASTPDVVKRCLGAGGRVMVPDISSGRMVLNVLQ